MLFRCKVHVTHVRFTCTLHLSSTVYVCVYSNAETKRPATEEPYPACNKATSSLQIGASPSMFLLLVHHLSSSSGSSVQTAYRETDVSNCSTFFHENHLY